MSSPVRDITQSTAVVTLRQPSELPSLNEAAAVTKAATQPLSLPDDIVTLSSLREESSPTKKASQPVSIEERKALLAPNSPRKNFSAYG